ncbi:MAG: hypothetical protein ACJ789_19220 [Thermomicrobiales bacterium]
MALSGSFRKRWQTAPISLDGGPQNVEATSFDAIPANRALQLTPISAVIILFAMRIVAMRWADFDLFRHLSNGRLWVDSGIFPSPDRFSWSAPGHTVIVHSIQFDRIFYLLWKLHGTEAIAAGAAVLFAGALLPYAFLLGRMGLNPFIETIGLILLVVMLLPYRGARPHFFGAVLFGILVLLAERPFGLRKAIVSGVVLGLWLNLHASFLVGFMLVGCAVAAWTLARDYRAAANASLALLMGSAATLVSRFGLDLWRLPFTVSSNDAFIHINGDWVGLRPLSPVDSLVGLLIVAATALGVWRRGDARALTALALLLPTIQYSRFSTFLAPLLFILVAERLAERAPYIVVNPLSNLGKTLIDGRLTKIAAVILLIGVFYASRFAPATLEGAAFSSMPESAVTELLACGQPAPVWNDFDWGAYLIWRGDGLYTIGIDGRAETVYPTQVFKDYFAVIQHAANWQELVQTSPAQYMLVKPEMKPFVEPLDGWQIVHTDGVAIVAKRDNAAWNCSR